MPVPLFASAEESGVCRTTFCEGNGFLLGSARFLASERARSVYVLFKELICCATHFFRFFPAHDELAWEAWGQGRRRDPTGWYLWRTVDRVVVLDS